MNSSTTLNLCDEALAAWLDECVESRHTVGYLHAQYVCKVLDLSDPGATLHPADPDRYSKKALKKLARLGSLKHLELPLDTLDGAFTVDQAWGLVSATGKEIEALIDERLQVLGRVTGRGPAISMPTAWKVWTDAGGRCMFEGCGTDLSEIKLYNKAARKGYLAHIVASDPRGPRGSQADSHRLSDKPENIMLMCDEHHRLIDSFSPAEYPADRLNEMRRTHRDRVRHYLGSLSWPRARAVTLHANLAQVPTHFHESELIDAILATGRGMLPGVVHYVRRQQRDDRRSPEFWVQYLDDHKLQIQNLVASFNSPDAADCDEWAVFPLHHVATLVLAGRIIGEARAIQVFQYHRHRRSWQWDHSESPQAAGTFNAEGLSPGRADEVLITIELTARIDEGAIPSKLVEGIETGPIPWVRITTPNPEGACIRHPDDLDQFMAVARRAINHVQDVMRASRVHLIAISPASTVFRFGQMLQAGHHPTYTIYDRASRNTQFVEAFSISGHEVTASAGSRTATIEIR